MKYSFGTITITAKAKELARQALNSGYVSCGKLVARFEKQFAAFSGAKEAVALSSGADADALALAVLYDYGAKRGDEIIVPALTFAATANAVLQAGFIPKFVDVEPNTLNIDSTKIQAVITKQTRAIMPVHLMGKPAPLREINTIAKINKIKVISDAAEAHGTLYYGKPISQWSEMTAYSLYVAHIISSIEGGMVVTDNPRYAAILRSLRSHGRACVCKTCVLNANAGSCRKRFIHGADIRFMFDRIGFSSKMNELEAAVGLGTMQKYKAIIAQRRENLLYLIEGFKRFAPYLGTITEEKHEVIGPHAFPFWVESGAGFTRNQLALVLEKSEIDTRTLFQCIPTQCSGYAFLHYKQNQFPVSDYLADNGLHIGIHQDITKKHLNYFLNVVNDFLVKYR